MENNFKMNNDKRNWIQINSETLKVTRRDFLQTSGLIFGGISLGLPLSCAQKTNNRKILSFVIVTDAHYADAAARGERHYRESQPKMAECVALANDKKVDFIIELGDYKDQDEPAAEENTLTYLDTIEKIFRQFNGPRYHVLGNHDMDSISKKQFMAHVDNTGITNTTGYYSFNSEKLHFVILDANYNSDGSDYDHGNFNWTDANIPSDELNWLADDLKSTFFPVIVFVHQQLDGNDNHSIRNASKVRDILQNSGKVLAVFQGHNHKGAYSIIEGIHYYTLKAMVTGSGKQNNSYACVEVHKNYDILVKGYRRAESENCQNTTITK